MVLEIIIVIVVILLSMTIHEAMHAFMGYALGDDTARQEGRLTLNPIRHIDPFMTVLLPLMMVLLHGPIFGGAKPVPFNPNRVRFGEWGAALVALSGPSTNCFYCIWFGGDLWHYYFWGSDTANYIWDGYLHYCICKFRIFYF